MSAQAETEQQKPNEVTITLEKFLKVLGGEFFRQLAPAAFKKPPGRVFLCTRLMDRICDAKTVGQKQVIQTDLLGIIEPEIQKMKADSNYEGALNLEYELCGDGKETKFQRDMLQRLRSDEVCSETELKVYSVVALKILCTELARHSSGIESLNTATAQLSSVVGLLQEKFDEMELSSILRGNSVSIFSDDNELCLEWSLNYLEFAFKHYQRARTHIGLFLDSEDEAEELNVNVFDAVVSLSRKEVLLSADLLVLDVLSPKAKIIISELPELNGLNYYSYQSIFKKLSENDKQALKAELLKLCNPSLEEGAKIRAIIQIALLACKGAAKVLPKNDGVRIDEFRKKWILATYNHFAALLGARAVTYLIDFDRAFKQMVFQNTTHFNPLFGHSGMTRFRMNAPLEMAEAKTPEFKNMTVKTSASMSGSTEEVKFLYVQQIIMTAGSIFIDSQNLKLAMQFVGEHRTWYGRLAKILFGFRTDAQTCIDNYYASIDSKSSAGERARLATCIQEYLQPRVERYGALESRFHGMPMHQKGMHVAPESQRGIIAH